MTENIIKTVPNELDGDQRYAIRVRTVNSFGVTSNWSETLIIDTNNAGASNSGRITLTANGLIAYDSNGQSSIIFSGSGITQRINYAINPSFEPNTSSWTALSNTTLTRSTAEFFVADAATPSYKACGEIEATTAGANVGILTSTADRISVTAGTAYTASIYVKAISLTVSLKIALRFYDNSGNLVRELSSFSSKTINADGEWIRLSCIDIRVPTGATKMGFVILSTGSMLAGQKYRVDGCLIEQSNTLGEYFDGSTSLGATKWNGTPHHSTSTFDLSNSSYVDGGVFTAGTVQTAVDVGIGSPYPNAGVVMNTEGLKGYSGGQSGPSFDLDTDGTLFVGREDIDPNGVKEYMRWDGTNIRFSTKTGGFFVGNDTDHISWDGENLIVTGGVSVPSIDIDNDSGDGGVTSFHIDEAGRMWLGANSFDLPAPFRVSAYGDLDIGGTDASSFHVDKDGNMWSGAGTYAAAPFKVSAGGTVAIASGQLDIGSGTSSFHVDPTGQVWSGASAYSAAPFKVSSDGKLFVVGTNSTIELSVSGGLTSLKFSGTAFDAAGAITSSNSLQLLGTGLMSIGSTGIGSGTLIGGTYYLTLSSSNSRSITFSNGSTGINLNTPSGIVTCSSGLLTGGSLTAYNGVLTVGSNHVTSTMQNKITMNQGTDHTWGSQQFIINDTGSAGDQQAGMAFWCSNSSSAPIIRSYGQFGDRIDFLNSGNTAYILIHIDDWVNETSTLGVKENIIEQDDNELLNKIAKVKTHHYKLKNRPLSLRLSEKFDTTNKRWIERGHTPLEPQIYHYESHAHDCTIDNCKGTLENPCIITMNDSDRYGLIVEHLHEIAPEVTYLDENNVPSGYYGGQVGAMAFGGVSALVRKYNELNDRLTILENK